MLASLARLFALRPFLTIAILGVPVMTLVLTGLFAVMAFKFLVFIVLPIAVVVWLVRRVMQGDRTVPAAPAPPASSMPVDPVEPLV